MHPLRRRLLAAMAAAGLLALLPSSAVRAGETPLAAMTRQAVDRYIIPAYADLAKSTVELRDRVDGYCQARTQTPVAEMLRPAIAAWSRVEFLRFGPMADQNRQERFAFFPDPKGAGPRQMRQFLASLAAGKSTAADIAKQSAAIQGLPALEMLLVGDFGELTEGDRAEQRCKVAEAIAANLAQMAQEIDAGWQSYRAIIIAPGPQNPLYRNDQEAATEILKAVSTGLQQLREQRIVPALGESEADAKPKRAPYYRSASTLDYLKASAYGLRDFAKASGLADLLPEDSRWIGASIDFEFVNLDRALNKLAQDRLFEAPQNRASLNYAVIVLNSLQDHFAVKLSGAIHLSPGFNALDGD